MSDWEFILELVKKELIKHKDGSQSVHYTSTKPGSKILYKDGKPVETDMNTNEKKNRGKASVSSSNKQKGITKINKKGEEEYFSKRGKNVPGRRKTK